MLLRFTAGCSLLLTAVYGQLLRLLPADEPSSGLDSFQAEQVMQTLKDLASDGHTVVSSSGPQQDTALHKD